jgi:hypothetical protein
LGRRRYLVLEIDGSIEAREKLVRDEEVATVECHWKHSVFRVGIIRQAICDLG